MHVVLLNQPFYPDVVATAQMGKDLADALVARGHAVSAVASRSIYGQAGATLPKHEVINTIEIHRVGSNLFGRKGLTARAFDFAMFYVLATVRILTMKRPDVVVGYTTPPFIALVALLSKWIRGSRAVYWIMDLYPDVAVDSGVFGAKSMPARVMEFLGRVLLTKCDATVVLGRCMRDRALAKGGPADKVHFIPVWSDESGVKPVAREQNQFRREWGLDDAFVVMYSGNFGIGHDCRTILEAILRLSREQEQGKSTLPRLHFLFVGGGKRKGEVLAFKEKHGLSSVSWREYVPREKLGESLSVADVHLISLRAGMEGMIVPSKLFGIMAAARPAIFVGRSASEIGRILTETGSGIVVRPGEAEAGTGEGSPSRGAAGAGSLESEPLGDVDALVEAIRTLAADRAKADEMGRRGREALLGKYDKSTACAQWGTLLEAITSR
ncbi:MAG: glycosyltransferase family 4 protein [Planctomycetota bacterium]|nr:glycosyltransferase family 4 protein [Planctomycetota bacterium]